MTEDVTAKEEDKAEFPVTREELYRQVWLKPMTALATKYKVSSSYLARVCTRLNVPRPERGYWAKLAVGKTVRQPSLPEAGPGDELEWSKEGDFTCKQRATPTAPLKIRRKSAKKGERSDQHHLMRGSKALFLKGRKTDDGYLKPHKRLLVDILVSESGLDKALDIMNQLLLALTSFDYRVQIAPAHEHFHRHEVDEREAPGKYKNYKNQWVPGRPTVVYVGTVAIGLTLYEFSEEVDVMYVNGDYIPLSDLKTIKMSRYQHSWTTTKDRPSGRFCLQAYSPYQGTTWAHAWNIDLKRDLTRQGNKIARALAQYAVAISEEVAEAERLAEIERQRREEMFKKWKLEEEERRRAKAFDDSKNELMMLIARWAEIKSIEDFFCEVELSITNLPPEEREVVTSRLDKAREMLGSADALQELRVWKSPDER